MLGAIVGDIVGSPYEFATNWTKSQDFPLFTEESHFTDDTLMTIAVGTALLDSGGIRAAADQLVIDHMRCLGAAYPLPKGGYGMRFARWLTSDRPVPYGSFGNGSAMRVSSVGWLFNSLPEVEEWAEITAHVTHSHPEGIKGAQVTATAVYLARTAASPHHARIAVRDRATRHYGYDLSRTCDDIRPGYVHVETCQETVPEALTAFLESDSFESAIRLAVSLGGDADTLTAITGSIAAAAYGIPGAMAAQARSRLSEDLLEALDRFDRQVAEGGFASH